MKQIKHPIVQLLLTLLLVACGSGASSPESETTDTTVSVTGVTITSAAPRVEVGEQVAVSTQVTPSNASNKRLNWSSSDTNVATVSSSGMVTGTATGLVTITVTTLDGGYSDQVNLSVEPSDGKSNLEYSIEQSLSERAQENTIAFDGLAFITGNQCSDSFFPPGKVADFFGYQFLRDNTPNGMGHNTSFVTNSANNLLSILTEEQKALLIEEAIAQDGLVRSFALGRLPLMKAFRMALEEGASLDKQAVIEYAAQLQKDDAVISIRRAKLFGSLVRSLDAEQLSFLEGMVTGGFESWAVLGDQIDKKAITHEQHVLVMTLASEMFGWYAGDVEADTYFAPERQANYFGSFFMKDAPAMGNPDYTIDETITGDKGEELLSYLSANQKLLVTDIYDIQYGNLLSIVELRRAISTELRRFLTQDTIDEAKVMSLSASYGEMDGENSYTQASHFAQLKTGLSETQADQLTLLRGLEEYPCPSGSLYVYSDLETISNLNKEVEIDVVAQTLLE